MRHTDGHRFPLSSESQAPLNSSSLHPGYSLINHQQYCVSTEKDIGANLECFASVFEQASRQPLRPVSAVQMI